MEALNVVWHVVMMKPRGGISRDERAQFKVAFEHAVRDIPTVRAVHVGRRFRHDAGYEPGMPDSADVVVVVMFDDRAGLQTYLRHPAHESLGDLFGRLLDSALVYDFEVGGMDMLQGIVDED